mmetsp:Transcript_68336/g.154717  ORF Transcript_68336/g.154717 Transcript_68336/m.154717 type:complete len:251 (+) Transcript_68336:1005-1757(+)
MVLDLLRRPFPRADHVRRHAAQLRGDRDLLQVSHGVEPLAAGLPFVPVAPDDGVVGLGGACHVDVAQRRVRHQVLRVRHPTVFLDDVKVTLLHQGLEKLQHESLLVRAQGVKLVEHDSVMLEEQVQAVHDSQRHHVACAETQGGRVGPGLVAERGSLRWLLARLDPNVTLAVLVWLHTVSTVEREHVRHVPPILPPSHALRGRGLPCLGEGLARLLEPSAERHDPLCDEDLLQAPGHVSVGARRRGEALL